MLIKSLLSQSLMKIHAQVHYIFPTQLKKQNIKVKESLPLAASDNEAIWVTSWGHKNMIFINKHILDVHR